MCTLPYRLLWCHFVQQTLEGLWDLSGSRSFVVRVSIFNFNSSSTDITMLFLGRGVWCFFIWENTRWNKNCSEGNKCSKCIHILFTTIIIREGAKRCEVNSRSNWNKAATSSPWPPGSTTSPLYLWFNALPFCEYYRDYIYIHCCINWSSSVTFANWIF
jgi:hypothetical protein